MVQETILAIVAMFFIYSLFQKKRWRLLFVIFLIVTYQLGLPHAKNSQIKTSQSQMQQ